MLTTGQVAISTTPAIIDGTHNSEFLLTIRNMDATDDVYIGNETVATTNGFALSKGNMIQIPMKPGDFVWAVSAKSGHLISWMKQV